MDLLDQVEEGGGVRDEGGGEGGDRATQVRLNLVARDEIVRDQNGFVVDNEEGDDDEGENGEDDHYNVEHDPMVSVLSYLEDSRIGINNVNPVRYFSEPQLTQAIESVNDCQIYIYLDEVWDTDRVN
jgi:hypothetical protein